MAYIEVIIILVALYFLCKWCLRRQMIGSYSGRHVLITGCDTGFGNQLAKRLDALNFTVFAGCLTEKGEIELKKGCSENVHVVSLDVTKLNSIEAALKFVEDKLPRNKGLWGVVNNAGIGGPFGPPDWLSRQDYDLTMAVNLFGMIEVTRVFLPLVRREKGRIVNMTSGMGRIALFPVPYSASKFAAEGYSDCLRRNLYNTGVSVHIIEPGFFKTNITNIENAVEKYKNEYKKLDNETKEFYGEDFPNSGANFIQMFLNKCSPDTYKVVDAYQHALCARFPKSRYVVGIDVNTIYRLIWNLPEWMSDYLICLGMPTPSGAKK